MEHKGTQCLETQRLILRPFKAEDGHAMFRNWCSDPEVSKYLSWAVHETEDVSLRLAAHWEEESKKLNCYQWCIVPKALGEPAGSIAVVAQEEDIAMAEIGYCLGRKWWGNGWTTEAAREVIAYLIRDVGFNRVQACHDPRNPGSGRVMIKAGMTFEGILRDAKKSNQGVHDAAMYSILAREWTERK